MQHGLFFDIGAILIFTAAIGLICKGMRQSLILAYIGTGIFMGPSGQNLLEYLNKIFNWNLPAFRLINNIDLINALSVFGIILLLFVVGLEMNIKGLRSLKTTLLGVCLGQMV